LHYSILCFLYLEFGDNTLKGLLEKINTNGWHFDKQSLSHNTSLTVEQLEPLLDHTPENSNKQNFESVNEDLIKLIKNESILDLIEIDIETVAIKGQPITIDSEDCSGVVNLLNNLIKKSAPQVCWPVSAHDHYVKSTILLYNYFFSFISRLLP